jgi:15-cis-phytoene synthase
MSGRDTSFYYSFLVLPERKRHAIISVWDFCRAVDDAVDETGGQDDDGAAAAEAIAAWREELDRVYTGDPHTPQGRALRPAVRDFGLPRQQFEALIDGVAMDLTRRRYATFEDLREYCVRVASAVGLICVEIFGYRDPQTRTYAVELGLALQLTNIVRDIAADLQQGRLYLPQEDLDRFGVCEADLREGRLTPSVRDLLRFECARARRFYERASASLPPRDARRLVAAEIMGGIYFGILRRIERAGYDVFSRRIRVPRPARALIAARIWLRTLVRPALGRATRPASLPEP